ncbi:unnamed protein product [Blepharisma stoltei]|uniref:Uncharacterized protein n=1 Tax=Blepharisma stoltei TaxID=1481888 RepID=A0AAU9KC70_9CILI|nr:unnamed protein product [Blepharisma stoltei]
MLSSPTIGNFDNFLIKNFGHLNLIPKALLCTPLIQLAWLEGARTTPFYLLFFDYSFVKNLRIPFKQLHKNSINGMSLKRKL